MKTTFILALLAVAVCAVPDWTAVSDKVQELRVLVRSTIDHVEQDANADNPVIGQEITTVLEGYVVTAAIVLAEAQDKIDAQTLTKPEAEAYMDRLKLILATAQADIAEELLQLSETTQEHIAEEFAEAYAQAEVIANDIYALLEM